MAVPRKPCLICGKPFKPCSTYINGMNWRRTFCSPECFEEWLRRQNAGRTVAEPVQEETAAEEVPVEETPAEEQENAKPASRLFRKKKDAE